LPDALSLPEEHRPQTIFSTSLCFVLPSPSSSSDAETQEAEVQYVAMEEPIHRLTVETFDARIPNLAQVLNYVDAAAYQLWDVKH